MKKIMKKTKYVYSPVFVFTEKKNVYRQGREVHSGSRDRCDPRMLVFHSLVASARQLQPWVAPGPYDRAGGTIQESHLPGGVPLACGHWRLRACVNVPAWGRWHGWWEGSAPDGEGLRCCGFPGTALEPKCVQNSGGRKAREPSGPNHPLSTPGDLQPCPVLDPWGSC